MIKLLIISLFIITIVPLSGINRVFADHYFSNNKPIENNKAYSIKQLTLSGKISSLENLLKKLAAQGIHRLLEIELKFDDSYQSQHPYIYEIEYINHKGMVLEIEVNALTAQILNIEREH